MPTLTAIAELRYAGRTVHPGDDFEASERDAKLLKAIKKAKDAGTQKSILDVPAAPVVGEDDDLPTLRSEYEAEVGKRPFMGWDASELKARMATYRRRDVTHYATTNVKAED